MIKVVIFDLDGTLLNRDASVHNFIDGQYDRFYEWISHIPKENYISKFIELDDRGYVWKDKVYKQMIKEFKITDISWERLLKDYLTEFHKSCIPFPDLITTLESLKERSIRLGMITNGKGQFQMDNIRALGIEHYFDTILISEWEGIRKPNPEIFYKALSQLHISSNESMFLGDHPQNDVKASMDIGMHGVWKMNSYWSHVEADYMIKDLLDLLKIINKVNGPF